MLAEAGDTGDQNEPKSKQKCAKITKMNLTLYQNHKNITKMATQIGPKSIKNRGCVADAFLERFGAALGHQIL